MSRLEVLVATTNQKDLSKYNEMNINSNVVFANQSNINNYEQVEINENLVRVITTKHRGVGKNRNLAMMYSNAEIILYADDDMNYVENYQEGIINAFEELKDADIIIFSCNIMKNKEIVRRANNRTKKITLFNSLKYGACVIAARRASIVKKNIWFSQLFGGGTIYGSGEDSLFLKECFEKGLKVYTHEFNIGNCNQDTSSWFNGYDEKFFYDKGAWISAAFPKIKYLMLIYFIYRFRNLSNLNIDEQFNLLREGIKGFNELKTYNDFNNCKLK